MSDDEGGSDCEFQGGRYSLLGNKEDLGRLIENGNFSLTYRDEYSEDEDEDGKDKKSHAASRENRRKFKAAIDVIRRKLEATYQDLKKTNNARIGEEVTCFNANTDLPICLREKIYLATGKEVTYFHGKITEVLYIDARTQEVTFRVILNREQFSVTNPLPRVFLSKGDTSAAVYNHQLIPTALFKGIPDSDTDSDSDVDEYGLREHHEKCMTIAEKQFNLSRPEIKAIRRINNETESRSDELYEKRRKDHRARQAKSPPPPPSLPSPPPLPSSADDDDDDAWFSCSDDEDEQEEEEEQKQQLKEEGEEDVQRQEKGAPEEKVEEDAQAATTFPPAAEPFASSTGSTGAPQQEQEDEEEEEQKVKAWLASYRLSHARKPLLEMGVETLEDLALDVKDEDAGQLALRSTIKVRRF